jgi:hypothetical protein
MEAPRLLICLAVAVSGLSCAADLPFEKARPGEWARDGKYLWPGPTAIADFPLGGRNIAVVSPDSTITLTVRDSEMTVSGPSVTSRSIGIDSLSEILWAPDSKAFAITSSDGGWVGTWTVTVHWRDGRTTNPSKAALQRFKREFPMCPDEFPNVAAVGWAQSSRNLRVLVEMPCRSSCPQMCKFRGFVVDSNQRTCRRAPLGGRSEASVGEVPRQ